MFAIIQIGGNQYKVTPGMEITVDRLAQEAGEKLSLPALLVADEGDVKLGEDAGKVMISATVVSHDQAEKLHVSRFRAKSRHRRHIGFRHQLTTLKIDKIGDVAASAPVKKEITAPKTKSAKKEAKAV